MSKNNDQNDFITSYSRLDRDNLAVDTNISNLNTSFSSSPYYDEINNKSYLFNRIGDIDNVLSHDALKNPIPGYCLRFDSNNPNAYIQTNIPSSDREKYNIIIRGEGTYSLYADSTTDKYIQIKQISTPSTTDSFILSYIAFLNRETNEIDYLFECEEGSDYYLYNAYDSSYAEIKNVTSITSLRSQSNSKEFIKSYSNLFTKIKTKASQITNINNKPVIESVPFTFLIELDQPDIIDVPSNLLAYPYTGLFTNQTASASVKGAWAYIQRNSSTTPQICAGFSTSIIARVTYPFNYFNKDGKNNVIAFNYYKNDEDKLQIDIYINGIKRGSGTTTWVDMTPSTCTNLTIGTPLYSDNKYHSKLIEDTFYRATAFNFKLPVDNTDTNYESIGYSMEDWINNKDIPTYLLLNTSDNKALLHLQNTRINNILSSHSTLQNYNKDLWIDSTINKNHMLINNNNNSLYNKFEIYRPYNAIYGLEYGNPEGYAVDESKQYGTFANYYGCYKNYNISCRCNTLGSNYRWTDDNGEAQVGWTGKLKSGVKYGGRGTASDGLVLAEGLPSSDTISLLEDFEKRNYLPLQIKAGSNCIICCETRDLSIDNDCPPEVQYAVNYLQYDIPSRNWTFLRVAAGNSFQTSIKNLLDKYEHPSDTNFFAKLKFRYSIWLKKLDNPILDSSEANNSSSGVFLGYNGFKRIPFKDIPNTWTKFEGEYIIADNTSAYPWVWSPAISAVVFMGSPITDEVKSKWTTNEPVVAMSNLRLDLIEVYDPNDKTKLWDKIPASELVKIYPRKLLK